MFLIIDQFEHDVKDEDNVETIENQMSRSHFVFKIFRSSFNSQPNEYSKWNEQSI